RGGRSLRLHRRFLVVDGAVKRPIHYSAVFFVLLPLQILAVFESSPRMPQKTTPSTPPETP
ncbi:MAG: hypothetical protein QF534_05070, partial [Phycisphaerales bacterium]|nr:hypothetical protein [Phycisphaerales bacterium]